MPFRIFGLSSIATALAPGTSCSAVRREPARYSLVRHGYNSELHLFSLEGAQRVLRSYCTSGITKNMDDALEAFEKAPASTNNSKIQPLQAAYLPVNRLGVWSVFGTRGHGSGYIQQTGHLLNSSSLREESAAWPLSAWCSDGTTLSPY